VERLLPSGLSIDLDGASLTIEQVAAVAAGAPVTLAPQALARMGATRAVVDRAVEDGAPVYGLTTGVAERKRVQLARGSLAAFNRRLIANHLVAQGPPAGPELVRATICCLANGLLTGYPGVRPELAERVAAALNATADGARLPRLRTLGSVGEADLGPLADLAAGLVGDGFELAAGEGLALIDNNAFSTAAAALALVTARRLLDNLEVAAALDLEAFAGNLDAVHEVVATARPQPGLRASLERLRAALAGSFLTEPGAARQLQDPLSFRCLPQLHGAARDLLAYAVGVVETDCNAALGNPLVSLEARRPVSQGNFDAVYVATALDAARIGLAPALVSAAERCVKLLQATASGLSPGLSADAETADDGLAELAVAAQSIAVEARLCAQPVSSELVSTSKAEGIEDRTSMAPLSARRLGEMAGLGTRLLAIELVVACQAVELRLGGGDVSARLGRGTAAAYRLVRRHVGFAGRGATVPSDLEPLVQALSSAMIEIAEGGEG
jgi:histidine ammonia-lyase